VLQRERALLQQQQQPPASGTQKEGNQGHSAPAPRQQQQHSPGSGAYGVAPAAAPPAAAGQGSPHWPGGQPHQGQAGPQGSPMRPRPQQGPGGSPGQQRMHCFLGAPAKVVAPSQVGPCSGCLSARACRALCTHTICQPQTRQLSSPSQACISAVATVTTVLLHMWACAGSNEACARGARPHRRHLTARFGPTHAHCHGLALQVPGLMAPAPPPAGAQPVPSAAPGPTAAPAAAAAAAPQGKAGRPRVRIVSANNSAQHPTTTAPPAAAGQMPPGAGQAMSPGALPTAAAAAGVPPQGAGSPGPHMIGPHSPSSPHLQLPNSYSGSWPGPPGGGSGSPGGAWVQGAGLPPPAWHQQGAPPPVASSWSGQPPPQQQQQGPWSPGGPPSMSQQGVASSSSGAPWQAGHNPAAAGGGAGVGPLSGAGSLAAEGSGGWGVAAGAADPEEVQRQARLAKQQQYKVSTGVCHSIENVPMHALGVVSRSCPDGAWCARHSPRSCYMIHCLCCWGGGVVVCRRSWSSRLRSARPPARPPRPPRSSRSVLPRRRLLLRRRPGTLLRVRCVPGVAGSRSRPGMGPP
jgi:hypothetical protein